MRQMTRGIPGSAVITAISAALILAAGPTWAEDDAPLTNVTFTKDVLPIIQSNCQTCHRTGGDNYTGMVAPMSLLNYAEVRPWAKSIADLVQTKTMPPWHASPEQHGIFGNERTLTDREIATIVKWVESGARRGNPADAPEPLVFEDTGGFRIGKPDLIITFDEPYLVKDDVQDEYVTITSSPIPEDILPEDTWVQAIEWQGGSDAVHHIVGYAIAGEKRASLGSIAPGEEPAHFPEGYAKLLPKGSRIVFSMHYHKEAGPGTAVWDQSKVAFKFHPDDVPLKHQVRQTAVSYRSFEIPPFHPDWEVSGGMTFKENSTLLALHPHMHLRGKDAKYIAYYPDGSVETLLDVPRYDFNWQTDYGYKVPKLVPAGTRIEFIVHYDNSPERAELAGINPSRSITFGGPTTDEMMLGYISYAETEPKDVRNDYDLSPRRRRQTDVVEEDFLEEESSSN